MKTHIAHRRLWIAAFVVLAVLTASACSSQAEFTNPSAVASPVAGNPGNPQPTAERGNPASGPAIEAPAPAEQLLAPTEARATDQPTVESAPTRTPVPPPTATSTPPPSPTPIPTPALFQLTTGGCCTQPSWSADSQRVLFIDKPSADAPVGFWGVSVTQPKSAPELVTERIGFYTSDFEYLIDLSGDTTIIERLSDGERWTVPAGGRPVSLSPSRQRIAWDVSDDDVPFERRTTQVWVANLDGSNARPVTKLNRGGFSDWISDDVLLLSSRESLQSREQIYFTYSLTSGQTTELVRSERLRGGLLSPSRKWMAYYVALDEDPAQNGLWLMRTDGSERRKLDRDLFGAYQWRAEAKLLIIPFDPNAESHALWEYDVEAGEARRLTDPDVTPFKIANGDWQVSPDGRYVAFVESSDYNIWVLDLTGFE